MTAQSLRKAFIQSLKLCFENNAWREQMIRAIEVKTDEEIIVDAKKIGWLLDED